MSHNGRTIGGIKRCYIIGWLGLIDSVFMIVTFGIWFPGCVKWYANYYIAGLAAAHSEDSPRPGDGVSK